MTWFEPVMHRQASDARKRTNPDAAPVMTAVRPLYSLMSSIYSLLILALSSMRSRGTRDPTNHPYRFSATRLYERAGIVPSAVPSGVTSRYG